MFDFMGAKRLVTDCKPRKAAARRAERAGVLSGLVSGTRVATQVGWRAVESLAEGDVVLTFDAGPQRIRAVSRTPIWEGRGTCPAQFWPLAVPAGAIGNSAPMRLLPRQGVMLESDRAEALSGDPFALIPAAALEGVGAIERSYPNDDLLIVSLHFDMAEVVFAEEGALMFCPEAANLLETAQAGYDYQMYSEREAAALVSGGGLGWAA